MDSNKSFSYTLLDVARIVSYRVGNMKIHVETLDDSNSDLSTVRILQAYDDVIREIIRTKRPNWALKEELLAPAAYQSTTASVTNGATAVTLGDSVAEDNHAHGLMYVHEVDDSARSVFLRIESVDAANKIELVDPFYFTTLSGDDVYILGDRVQLPSDFMGLVGAYGYGRSLTYKKPQELALIRQRLHSQATPYSQDGPQFCTLTRDTKSASTDQTYSYYLELYKAPQYARGINVIYIADYATGMDNITDPDSIVAHIPEDAVDVLVDGIVANLISSDIPDRRDAVQRWRNTVLADYVVEGSNPFDETVTFIDEVS